MASETYASCHTHTHHSMCSDHTSLSHYNRIFKKTLEMITMIMIRRCCVEHAGRSHRSFSVSMVCVVISMETIVYNTLLVASCKSTKKKPQRGSYLIHSRQTMPTTTCYSNKLPFYLLIKSCKNCRTITHFSSSLSFFLHI